MEKLHNNSCISYSCTVMQSDTSDSFTTYNNYGPYGHIIAHRLLAVTKLKLVHERAEREK